MTRESEAAFQTAVTNLATHYGWRWYHPPDNRPVRTRSGRTIKQNVKRGYPDLTLIRDTVLLVRELKTDKGRVDPEQIEWLHAFRAAGVDAEVWRPRDWPLIQQTLSAGRHQLPTERDDVAPPSEPGCRRCGHPREHHEPYGNSREHEGCCWVGYDGYSEAA